MAIKNTLPPLAGLVTKVDEPLTINKQTFEVVGSNTGKVYKKGSSLGEALALQQQLVSGSTPSLTGAPNIYAVEPTAVEKAAGIAPIVPQKGFAPVAPSVATSQQLAQAAAGTLPTFGASQAGAGIKADVGSFSSLVSKVVENAQKKGQEDMFGDTSSKSFDNQLLIQQGLIYKQLFGESLTPKELQWLSPSQQSAIKNANKEQLKAELAGINSIIAGREERRKEEEEKQEKLKAQQAAKSEATFNLYAKYRLWDKLSPGDKASLEQTLGMPAGTIDSIAESQKGEDVVYDLNSLGDGQFIQFKKDANTGEVLDQKIISSGQLKVGVVESGGITGGISTGGMGGFVTPVSKIDISKNLDKSGFDEYLKQAQEKALMSFAPQKVKELKSEWEKLQVAAKPESVDTSQFSPVVQLLIKGVLKPSGLTQTEKKQYAAQINQAADLGLIPLETNADKADTFSKLASEYQKSPSIQGAEKMAGYLTIAKTAAQKKTNQSDLALVYAFIKALDFGDSAVREGELALAQKVQTIGGQIEGLKGKVDGGGVLGTKDRNALVDALNSLVTSINSVAQSKEKMFESKANVLGVKDQWALFTSGYNPVYGNSVDKILWENGALETTASLLQKYNVKTK